MESYKDKVVLIRDYHSKKISNDVLYRIIHDSIMVFTLQQLKTDNLLSFDDDIILVDSNNSIHYTVSIL